MEPVKVVFGIDCEPCTPRPDVYAKDIFAMLNKEYQEPYSKMFGAWEWEVEVDNCCDIEQKLNCIHERFETLYNQGYIRGAYVNLR